MFRRQKGGRRKEGRRGALIIYVSSAIAAGSGVGSSNLSLAVIEVARVIPGAVPTEYCDTDLPAYSDTLGNQLSVTLRGRLFTLSL